jgi:histidinol dehydrogenase
MRCERLTLTDYAAAAAGAVKLRTLIPPPESVHEVVAEIIAEVKAHGDMALLDYTRRFDTAGADPLPLRVADLELERALESLDPPVRHAIERAIENVDAVSAAWGAEPERTVDLDRSRVVLRHAPVNRAAIYVPGGRAPYPSTVVMGTVPARLAGVSEIVVVSPPGRDGELTTAAAGPAAFTEWEARRRSPRSPTGPSRSPRST